MVSFNSNPSCRNLSFKKVHVDTSVWLTAASLNLRATEAYMNLGKVEPDLIEISDKSGVNLEFKIIDECVQSDDAKSVFVKKMEINGSKPMGKIEWLMNNGIPVPIVSERLDLKDCTSENLKEKALSVINDTKAQLKKGPATVHLDVDSLQDLKFKPLRASIIKALPELEKMSKDSDLDLNFTVKGCTINPNSLPLSINAYNLEISSKNELTKKIKKESIDLTSVDDSILDNTRDTDSANPNIFGIHCTPDQIINAAKKVLQ